MKQSLQVTPDQVLWPLCGHESSTKDRFFFLRLFILEGTEVKVSSVSQVNCKKLRKMSLDKLILVEKHCSEVWCFQDNGLTDMALCNTVPTIAIYCNS